VFQEKSNFGFALISNATLKLVMSFKSFYGINLSIPQTRSSDFYPNCLEKGLRSERALNRKEITVPRYNCCLFNFFIAI
jgi:hypothetical protein